MRSPTTGVPFTRAAEPGEIGMRWETEFKVPYEEKYHRLNTALFAARDSLGRHGHDQQ